MYSHLAKSIITTLSKVKIKSKTRCPMCKIYPGQTLQKRITSIVQGSKDGSRL
jgi:predicted transcriptional regulator